MSRAKKISDSFIMTLRTTSMAPKKRIVSRYSSNLIQNMGAENAAKSQNSPPSLGNITYPKSYS